MIHSVSFDEKVVISFYVVIFIARLHPVKCQRLSCFIRELKCNNRTIKFIGASKCLRSVGCRIIVIVLKSVVSIEANVYQSFWLVPIAYQVLFC